MLSPKKMKWRKHRKGKGRLTGRATRGAEVSFGDYGLQCTQAGWITARQIEATRIAISRSVKRGGKVWIRIFPDKPITNKPAEVRMGKGKGSVEKWVAPVKPGRVLFEINGVTKEQAAAAFTLASHKLPIKTRFLERTSI